MTQKTMRIASGGVQHETNTFAASPTTLEDFVQDSGCGPDLAGGDPIRQYYRGTGTIHGGYFAGSEEIGAELLPLLCAKANPSGPVQQSALDTMLSWFLRRLDGVLPVDGVLLDLHGAMVTDEHEDAEGFFIRAVRDRVGSEIPIVVTLDLHANITALMAEQSDVIIGYDTYPHIDMAQRGQEAVGVLGGMIRGKIRPVQHYRRLPLLTMPPMQCTLREPMQTLMRRVHAMEREPGVLTATVSMGFPFADISHAGVSVLVTADADRELAVRRSEQLAGWIWDLREELQPTLTKVEDGIRFVQDHPDDGLTIFADGSDNPGGGAPSDGTVALQALMDSDLEGAVVAVMCDPETAAQSHRAGVGKTISVRLGGKTDDRHGAPVVGEAYVRLLCDGRFVHRGAMARGVVGDLGPTATLVIAGVEVVVSSRRRQCLDAEMLRIAGIEPSSRNLLVLKSAVHFRADFAPMAAHIFDADTPGIHRPDFSAFDYRRIRRPIYPIDPEAMW